MADFSAISAPGKALLAGGYLILDSQQIGLVLALSARIHVVTVGDDSVPPEGLIAVTSTQFVGAEWKYKCTVDDAETLHVEDLYFPSTPLCSFKFPMRTK